jgi:CPA2 family monovalent cation:H+ antiporter-2
MDGHVGELGEELAHVSRALGLMDEIALVLIFSLAGGLLAARLLLPALIGFLSAGIFLGPSVPGFIEDVHTAEQLGEIGVVLLMFGVGLHFSLRDLAAVRNVAIPGAIVQSLLATGVTLAIVLSLGWSLGAGLVLGLALSVASTVVLVRALLAINALNTNAGRVAIGWLVVEDLFSAFVLVLLPILATMLGGKVISRGPEDTLKLVLVTEGDSILAFAIRMLGIPESVLSLVLITLANVVMLVAFVLVAAKYLIPRLLDAIEATGSEELRTLGAVAVALFVAFATRAVFGLSVAIGAFFAGIAVGSARQSHTISEDVRPSRDLFGVIFFASVGMLFDPTAPLQMPLLVLAVLAVILVVKPLAAGGIALLFRQPWETALTVAPGLAQIGEFSFILATLGRATGLLPAEGYQLVITGSIISIALNPVAFRVADAIGARRLALRPAQATGVEPPGRPQ